MYSEIFISLGLPLVETWCIEGIIFFLNFRGSGRKLHWGKMSGIFLLVNACTNLPLNLIAMLLGSRVSHIMLIIYITVMEGAVVPLTEAVLYWKMLGLRSAVDWLIISYEMNLVSYAGPVIFYFLKGGI